MNLADHLNTREIITEGEVPAKAMFQSTIEEI
jgi:hypothetical protein